MTQQDPTPGSAAQSHWYGFFLSLLTAVMWGTLPIALQLLMKSLDAITITWVRFLFSAAFVWLLLWRRGKLPVLRSFSLRTHSLTLIAVVALMGNFLLYLVGLKLLNPEATGIIIQIAPFLLMFGSVWFYHEHLTRADMVALVVLVGGLLLFFNDRLDELLGSSPGYTLGVVVMMLAALSWSVYGLLQKTLMRQMSSMQLTLLIYVGGAAFLLLPGSPLALLKLDLLNSGLVLFSCLNMVLGYGAFTEAIRVWQAARVSAVISLAPVITIICMPLAVWLWPQYYQSSQLNWLSYVGAAAVVAGSMLLALARTPARRRA